MNARPATASPATDIGPVQMLVFEFEQERLAGDIFPELMALAARGTFRVSLSGGSTPKALFALLASDEFVGRYPWAQVSWYWGDLPV